VTGRGYLKRVLVLVLLLAVVAGALLFRDRLRLAWREFRGLEEAAQPTPELAAAAERKLQSLSDGRTRSVALTQVELQSLLLYRYRGLFPAFLDSPTVELHEDQIRLRAKMPVDKLPNVDGLGDVAAILPDTTELRLDGKLLPLDSGRIGFGIDEVSASRVPLPRRLVQRALRRLGRVDEAGLPQDAVAVPLPPGVAAAQNERQWRASWSLMTKRGSARSCGRCSSTRGTMSASRAAAAKRSSSTPRRGRISPSWT
jgi:hypothetical protein